MTETNRLPTWQDILDSHNLPLIRSVSWIVNFQVESCCDDETGIEEIEIRLESPEMLPYPPYLQVGNEKWNIVDRTWEGNDRGNIEYKWVFRNNIQPQISTREINGSFTQTWNENQWYTLLSAVAEEISVPSSIISFDTVQHKCEEAIEAFTQLESSCKTTSESLEKLAEGICSTCEGRGSLDKIGEWELVENYKKCPDCKGTGVNK